MAEGGRLQLVLAAVAGLVTGCASAALAFVSGWFAGGAAVVLGAAVAVFVTTTLLVARSRARTL